jgi:hypothetical protein
MRTVQLMSVDGSRLVPTIEIGDTSERFCFGTLPSDVVAVIRVDLNRSPQRLGNGGWGFDPVVGTVEGYIWQR